MSARSSLLVSVALVACHKTPPKPEADPATIVALAKTMLANVPPPAGVRDCTTADVIGAMSMTFRTLIQLAGDPISNVPERAEWINPPELDAPAARLLAEPSKDEPARRVAAAEILAAPSYIVYRVEMVNAPIALMIKELKRGGVGMRAIGYDKHGLPSCAHVFVVQNDKAKSEWAMDKSDRATIDPAIAKAMRDDLHEQLLKTVTSLTAPPPAS